MTTRLLAGLAFVMLCCTARPTRAEDIDKEARESFSEGVKAFEQARLADALSAFKRAYALRPSYRILYNIAQTEAELGHPHLAIEAFEGYLADGGNRIEKERRTTIEQEIKRLRGIVGELIIKGPDGAEVWIDGERKGYLPLAGSILMPEGRHRLTVRHRNNEPCEEEISVKGGAKQEESCLLLDQQLTLSRLAAVEESAAEHSPPPVGLQIENREKRDFVLDSVLPWATTGLAAATLTAGIVCAWKASDLNGELNTACPDGKCPADRQNDMERLPRLAHATDGLLVTTAVLSAAAVLLFTHPWKTKKVSGESERLEQKE